MMFYSQEPHGLFMLIDNKSFYASVECVQRGLNPLTTPLVVFSEADNTGTGLVVAASPMAKKIFHIKNVDRGYQIPQDPRLLMVPPRMNLYIKKNLQINQIFTKYTDRVSPYSIDESILDLTHSWQLFGQSPQQVARTIQKDVYRHLGLVTTVGIGENPLQAKLALDLYAKHNDHFIGIITYQTVPKMIWPVKELTDIWGIGKRMALRLNKLGIHNMYELAHVNPYQLTEHLGLTGSDLYATAWGIDRTDITKPVPPQNKSIGNSQVLPRDYHHQSEIETVIKEITAQVVARINRHQLQTRVVHLAITYSGHYYHPNHKNYFAHSHHIPPTADEKEIRLQILTIFRKYWDGRPVRDIAISCGQLSPETGEQLNIFHSSKNSDYRLQQVIANIRNKYGNTAIMSANSLKKGGTFIKRAGLVGGHNGGNAFE